MKRKLFSVVLITFVVVLLVTVAIMFTTVQSATGEICVAVASNFTDTIKDIAERFEAKTDRNVVLVFGSTGKLYAQIKNGAPFDIFFAAAVREPELLEKEGPAVPGSRFTYAVGKLVLWSPEAGYVDREGKVLEQADFRHLAIANPKLAPYGRAAQEVLQARGIWDELSERLVRGENISQTFQFVKSGNAELGFVACSQVKRPGQSIEGSWWEAPQTLYSPIEQQAVLLKDSKIARDFLVFVRSEEALKIIREYGYSTP
ncbi:MAG: molybdate ABC transporter substrate-binding protein [Phycisphaerales bacterium]|nr:MAG: molybdate ABC transporter substrate-binding protein [Phycisphaerales bacterium]